MNSIDHHKIADQQTMTNIRVLVGGLVALTALLVVAVMIIG